MFKFFEDLVDPFLARPKESGSNSVYGFLKSQVSGLRKYILITAVFSALVAISEIYMFYYVGVLVDGLKLVEPSNFFNQNRDIITQLCLLLLVIFPAAVFFQTLFCNQTLEGNLPFGILSDRHRYLIKQSMNLYQQESAGKIANTLLQTADASKGMVIRLAYTFVFALTFLLSMGFLLASIDPYLIVPVVLWVVAFLLGISYLIPRFKTLSNKEAAIRSEMVGQLVDTYTNIATVKLFSHSEIEHKYAKDYMSDSLKATQKRTRFSSKMTFLITVLNAALISSTILMSLMLWGSGIVTIGAVAAIIGAVLRIFTMSHWVLWEAVSLFYGFGIVSNGIQLLSKPASNQANNTQMCSFGKDNGITFKNVNFSYNENSHAIRNLNLDIKPGEKLGVIGRSGSGKSTLAKLLLRFNDVSSGEIIVGEHNIQKLYHESLLEKVSVVTQDVELLDRTVRQNISYGKENVSDFELMQAAKVAGAHEFIMKLIDERGATGYDARVGVRGSRLSGGQKQRITIARALIKDAPIMIFDEATSALDSEIEAEIMDNIQEHLAGKTVIIITHRLAVLSGMNRIAVFSDGELIEVGSHDQLKASKGHYYNMLNMQSGLIVQVESEAYA